MATVELQFNQLCCAGHCPEFTTAPSSLHFDMHMSALCYCIFIEGCHVTDNPTHQTFFLTLSLTCVYRTWAQTIPGHVEFFSSEGSDTSIPIPIVALRNVDDSYPPQKKSFMMLKYMHDHYLDRYEWFMRADDDVYIKSEKLESFLRSLNSSEAIFLGQTGMGARDELGKLALEPGENFCMGGPGVIMSREVLKRMVPHIRECLQEMYTTHEDVEVGRCVRRFAGVQCVWSYEVILFSYRILNVMASKTHILGTQDPNLISDKCSTFCCSICSHLRNFSNSLRQAPKQKSSYCDVYF